MKSAISATSMARFWCSFRRGWLSRRMSRGRFSKACVAAPIVCEPRHPSWFTPGVERLLHDLQIARVAADPAVVPAAADPGGWPSLVYYRLHGSPDVYYSAYSSAYLSDLAARMRTHGERGVPVWCIFDNTARGAATLNAFELSKLIAAASHCV